MTEPDCIQDANVHPTTLGVLRLLRELLLADEATALSLLSHYAAINDDRVLKIENLFVQQVPPKGVALGVLGLLNSVLHITGADQIGAIIDGHGTLTGFVGAKPKPTTEPT